MPGRGSRRTPVVVSAVVAVVAPLLAVASPDRPAVAAGGAGWCAPVEVQVGSVPVVANPFDPAQIDVTVTFDGPGSAEIVTDAFVDQEYSRALVGGFEHLSAEGPTTWSARATPTPGAWTWTATVSVGGAPPSTVDDGAFSCAPDPAAHGTLRRSPLDDRYLAWEDGTSYVALGENLGWYGPGGTYDYDRWLDRLAAHGATWIRLWMPSWAMGLEAIRRDGSGAVIESSLGDYTTRLDRAWQLDHVIEAARERGMVVMLSIQYHGQFSVGANSEWADSPYNVANGGPLSDPGDFFTDPTARMLFERRLRYIVARWGYAPNLIWELWNEVDLTPGDPAEVTAWHVDMAGVIDALDPYEHLLTTSVDGALLGEVVGGGGGPWTDLFARPEIDLVQVHLYGIGNDLPLDFVHLVHDNVGVLAALGKPLLLGEVGVDYRGPAETLAADPDYLGLHELVWTGFFAGGAGGGMSWWWDNRIDPDDRYDVLVDGLGALTDGIALDEQGVDDDAVTVSRDGGTTEVFGLRGRTAALAWVRNAEVFWHDAEPSPTTGSAVTVEGLRPGRWRWRWLEPLGGATVAAGAVTVNASGEATLAVPAFTRDIALRLDVGAAPATPTPPSTVPPSASPAAPQPNPPDFAG